MVAMKGMIDVWEFDGVEFDDFYAVVFYLFKVSVSKWPVVRTVAESVKHGPDFYAFTRFLS